MVWRSGATTLVCMLMWCCAARAAFNFNAIMPISSLPNAYYAVPYDVNAWGVVVRRTERTSTTGQHVQSIPCDAGRAGDRHRTGKPHRSSTAFSINDSGVIVGEINGSPTRWTNGVAQTLAGFTSLARINALGHVLGGKPVGGFHHAIRFLPAGGDFYDLGTFPGVSGADVYGTDINRNTVICGYASNSSGTWRAFRQFNFGPLEELGALPSNFFSQAFAINDGGIIVGHYQDDAGTLSHAFRWRGSAIEDLGTLPSCPQSFALDINSAQDIVGYATDGLNTERAVAWKRDGAIVDLDAWLDQTNPSAGANWQLSRAVSVNNGGLVVGNGWYQGHYAGFVLDASGFLPEPSALMITSWGLLAIRRSRRAP